MLAISSLSLGCKIIALVSFDSLKNVYVNILCFFCSFSCRGRVIIKDIYNIIGIGYSIIIIKRQDNSTWDATAFREIRDLIPSHMFLILFQFLSKYLSQ